MLDAAELEELRALQARAYGREAALSQADAVRLRDLEQRRVARAPEMPEEGAVETIAAAPREPGPLASEDDDGAPAAAAADEADASSDDADTDGDADARRSAPPLRTLLRRHWRPVALVAVGMLLLGVGVGWLAFGRSAPAPVALTAEQQGWQDDLVSSGVYDTGSVRALAVEEGAGIWVATTDGGARSCLILSTGDATQPSCDRRETVLHTGLYGSIAVENARQVSVQMLFTAAGEPAVAVSSYDYDPSVGGITYANEQESDTAKRLVDEGFDANSLWVVGYDGDVPVWTGVQTSTQNQCLIYDGSAADAPVICADPETMQDQSTSRLVLNVVDSETGAATHLELLTNRGPAYLVITREAGVIGAADD